jgi:tRNA(Ile)-lysidine synthetase-like protein
VAIHVDHGLRPESGAEASHAARLAARLGVPFGAERLAPGSLDRHPGVGLEEAIRRERYLTLAGRAVELGADTLVVAHQREDQAESTLLHLTRGAGLAGARAMAEWSEREIPWWPTADPVPLRLWIWRPLLLESRAELADYLDLLGLTPNDDPSNTDPAYRRNRVRHAVLPCLEEALPGATAALARYGALVGDDDDVLDRLADAALAEARDDDDTIRVGPLLAHHAAIQRRAIRRWLRRALPAVELTMDRIDAVRGLALSARGGRFVEVGGGATVEARRGRLSLGGTGANREGRRSHAGVASRHLTGQPPTDTTRSECAR